MKLLRRKSSPYYFVDHLLEDGSRLRQSLKTADKTIARMRARQLVAAMEEKRSFVAKRGTFLAEYLKYARPRKSQRTVKTEVLVWQKFTAFIGSENPNDATEQKVEQFFTHMMEQRREDRDKKQIPKYRPATINSYHRVLRLMFNKAVRWKYAFSNPLKEIEMLRFEPEPPRFLSQAEIHRFFGKARQLFPHLLPLFTFYFLTGLRRSEAFRLTWGDVDFERHILTVRKTKGKRPRFVPLTPEAERILKQRTALPEPFSADISRELGSNPGPIQRIVAAAELTNVSLHDLRRSFATYMAPHINKTLLQQLIGHEDYSVTDVFYIGTNSDMLRKKMSVLDAMLKEINAN